MFRITKIVFLHDVNGIFLCIDVLMFYYKIKWKKKKFKIILKNIFEMHVLYTTPQNNLRIVKTLSSTFMKLEWMYQPYNN